MTDSIMYVGKVWGEESISNYHAYLIRGEFQNGTKPPSMNAFSCGSQSQHLYHFRRVAEEKYISPWIGLLNSVGRSSNFTCLQRGKERERASSKNRSSSGPGPCQQKLRNVGKFRPRNFRVPLHHHLLLLLPRSLQPTLSWRSQALDLCLTLGLSLL